MKPDVCDKRPKPGRWEEESDGETEGQKRSIDILSGSGSFLAHRGSEMVHMEMAGQKKKEKAFKGFFSFFILSHWRNISPSPSTMNDELRRRHTVLGGLLGVFSV